MHDGGVHTWGWCGACVRTPSQERGGLEESDRVNFTPCGLRYIIYSAHTKQAPDSFTESNRLTSSSTPRKRLRSWLQLLSSPTFSSGRCWEPGTAGEEKPFQQRVRGQERWWTRKDEMSGARDQHWFPFYSLEQTMVEKEERGSIRFQNHPSSSLLLVDQSQASSPRTCSQSLNCCFLASDDTGGCTHCDVTKSLVIDFVCHPQVARGIQTSSMLSFSDHCHVIYARFYAMGHPGSQ